MFEMAKFFLYLYTDTIQNKYKLKWKRHWGILWGKYCIALAKEGHSIAKSLVKTLQSWHEKSAKDIAALPYPCDTVARQIEDVDINVKTELISQLQNRTWAILHQWYLCGKCFKVERKKSQSHLRTTLKSTESY